MLRLHAAVNSAIQAAMASLQLLGGPTRASLPSVDWQHVRDRFLGCASACLQGIHGTLLACWAGISKLGRFCLPLCAALLLMVLLLGLNAASTLYVKQRAPEYVVCPWPNRNSALVCKHTSEDPATLVERQLSPNTTFKQPDVVVVGCRLTDLDNVVDQKVDMTCNVGSFGRYSKQHTWNLLQFPQNQRLCIQINSQLLNLSDGQAPDTVQQTLPLGLPHGDASQGVAAYPYSAFSFQLSISAWTEYVDSGDIDTPPPLYFSFVHGYHNLYDVQVADHPQVISYTVITLSGEITLNQLSQHLFVLLQIVMWMVTFLTVVSSTLWAYQVDPERNKHGTTDLLSFSGALLFALPTTRQLWIAAPVGGTKVDVLCIYAQLVCVGAAIIAQLTRRVWHDLRS